ncbi:uncharacterized protein LOC119081440 [Bradysia coprophila]|uniref:uncharacterized protein LOC119081440 n=1 Tax=Bradysia coprophila TaxID=38358 RepID=UPI00187D9CD3|nr:uncharacterized protein LOC119081440 [Bradysia coprophila]
MSPRKKQKYDMISWTKMETSQLIASIKAQLKKHDPLPYSRRISVLNWNEISIPHKSIKECKGHLDVLIKKIHRTRTLAEILSEVNVEPVDVICGQNGGDMTKSDIVPNSINNNENSSVIRCCSRRSKRLSENERRGSEEYSLQGRSHLDPFAMFAKHNCAKLTNKKSLKERYDQLDDGEKLIWIRKAAAASKDEKVKNILTDDEYVLLQKDCQVKGESVNPSKNHKRKLVDNDDDANLSSKEKVRKLEETSVDCQTDEMIEEKEQIDTEATTQEVMVVNESIHCANVVDQLCSSSAADIEMEGNGTEISSLDDNAGDEADEPTANANENHSLAKLSLVAGAIEPEEEMGIGSSQGLLNVPSSTSGTMTITGHSETLIKSEDGSKIEEVEEFKNEEEHIESNGEIQHLTRHVLSAKPPVFSRIRTICAGLFGRFGIWTIKKE